MQNAGETDADTCAYNDLALVRLDPADHAKVNPSIPFWGGPTGLTDSTATGAKVLSYGNSSLRGGLTQLSPKEGVSLGQSGGGWTHSVFTVTPGIPGDSGSAFIDKQGRAFGTLVDAGDRAAGRLERRRRPVARAGLRVVARRARDAGDRHRGVPRPAAADSLDPS